LKAIISKGVSVSALGKEGDRFYKVRIQQISDIMSRVVLFNPNQLEPSENYLCDRGIEESIAPSLGTAMLAQDSINHGHETRIVDHLSLLLQKKKGSVNISRDGFKAIAGYRPDVVGVNIMTTTRKISIGMIIEIKRRIPGVRIVAGGAHATLMADQTLKHYPVDVVAKGESEKAFGRIVDALTSAKVHDELSGIRNIAYREGERIIHTKNDPGLYKNIEEQPIPDYMKLYGSGIRTASVITTMGCYYNKCRYCSSKNLVGKGLRVKPVSRVLEEIDTLKKIGIKNIQFEDNTFTYDIERSKEIFRRLKESGLKFSLITRIDNIDEGIARLWSETGNVYVEIAVETGSDELRALMGKNLTNESIIRGADILHKHNIPFGVYIMLGFPGETKKYMEETDRLLGRIRPAGISAATFQINPGSDVYYEALKSGRIKEEDFLDLNKRVYHWYKGKKHKEMLEFAKYLQKKYDHLPRFESSNWFFETK